MRYISTRGGGAPMGFSDAVMTGLARDGGLLLPAAIPDVRDRLAEWSGLSYPDLAFEIMRLFADLPEVDLRVLIRDACAVFRHPDVTPVRRVGEIHVLELFHGPTLAFKDVALQFLGGLFEYLLERRGHDLNILAATSGDTGSAAIHGVRGRRHIRIFVLYPRGRVSPLQELQMTTVPDDNVHCAAVEGTFDDCQGLVKTLFNDLAFRDAQTLGAVNSINWARVLAQIVYYFFAAFRVMDETRPARVRFAVPTGNFGDIFAGYVAARMGLPIAKLVLAANDNDILARFFKTGVYEKGGVHATLSPSMDIQVASNFERYLYYRAGERPDTVRDWMDAFQATGRLILPDWPAKPDPLFAAESADRSDTLAVIRDCWKRHRYLPDPHTAVGLHAAARFAEPGEPMIALATAHPAKFAEAVREAVGDVPAARHPVLDELADRPFRRAVLPAAPEAVRDWIARPIHPPFQQPGTNPCSNP